MLLQPWIAVPLRLQELVLNSSINVFVVVNVEGDDVNETEIVTVVEDAGTTKRYQTSARVPHPPAIVVELALKRSPAVVVHSPLTGRRVAVAQVLLAACAKALECVNIAAMSTAIKTKDRRFNRLRPDGFIVLDLVGKSLSSVSTAKIRPGTTPLSETLK
jgi:hypothetical protein